jgi:ABC-type glycerol-3-phosphate transport system substrate-binding protein
MRNRIIIALALAGAAVLAGCGAASEGPDYNNSNYFDVDSKTEAAFLYAWNRSDSDTQDAVCAYWDESPVDAYSDFVGVWGDNDPPSFNDMMALLRKYC